MAYLLRIQSAHMGSPTQTCEPANQTTRLPANQDIYRQLYLSSCLCAERGVGSGGQIRGGVGTNEICYSKPYLIIYERKRKQGTS